MKTGRFWIIALIDLALSNTCTKIVHFFNNQHFSDPQHLKEVRGLTQNNISWDGELYLDFALMGANFLNVRQFWSGFRIRKVQFLEDLYYQS